MKKLHLLGCSSIAALSMLAFPSVSFAQDADAAEDDVIVVRGIRRSLQDAADIKRNEAGVVDAITAEDIGKFPDTNLAESLQRITGVSIDRQNNEGNQVSVRGLGPSFNLVTLNGRQMPRSSSEESETVNSSTQSRAFNFAEIAAESVAGVNVFKTVRANNPTGGIGATIDIRTARPLDLDNGTINLRAAGVHDFSTGGDDGDLNTITPEFGGLVSFKLFDGKLGLLANGSFARRDFVDREEHTDGFLRLTPGTVEFDGLVPLAGATGLTEIFRPITNISEISLNERTRSNGQFVAQFEPFEGFRATFDYTLSRFRRDEQRFQSGAFGDLTARIQGGLVNSVALDENGTITSINFDYGTTGGIDFLFYENELVIENDSFGGNINWQVGERLSLDFDFHSSQSQSQPNGEFNDLLGLFQGALGLTNVTFDYPGGDTAFAASFDDSTAFRGEDPFGGGTPIPGVTSALDPDGLSPLGTFLRNISIDNDVTQFQFNGKWDAGDNSWLKSVEFGGSFIDFEVFTSGISTGFVFQGLGANPTFPGGATVPIPCDVCSEGSGEFVDGGGTGIEGGFPTILRAADPVGLFNSFFFQLDDLQPQISEFDTSEESFAGFVNFNLEGEIGGMVAKAALGVRYETTNIVGTAFQNLPLSLTTTSLTEQVVNFSPEVIPFTLEGQYDEFLPAVDLQLQPNDQWVLRLSYGRSLARPDLNALRPSLLIAEVDPFGPFNAFQGNPNLAPFLADNIDLAAEWYYRDDSFFAVNYFFKNVSNFIGSDTVPGQTIFSASGEPLTDPSARFIPADAMGPGSGAVTGNATDPVAPFSITAPFNEDESATIHGVEVALQHVFENGFGLQANYTFVTSDAEFDPSTIEQQVNLLGLSDSANLVGFYENDRFQVRVAANYRSEFLFATNQLRVPGEPVFFDDFIQVDASGSYNINDNFSLYLDAINITGADQTQFGRFRNQVLFTNDQRARITFGVRASF